jgi:aminopeptidase N
MVADITQHETAERARLLELDSYDIELDLTRVGQVFGSTTVIRFGCSVPGASTFADLIAETVHEITLNGAAVDPAGAVADGRIELTGLAARNELRVVADCLYSADVSGLSRTVDSADGRTYTFTQFEPADARRVFASFEQPDLKASFTLHVTVPEHWIVLSNQPAPFPRREGDGIATWHFEPTPRISSYLVAVVAGEYHLVTRPHLTPAGTSIPLGVACRQSLAAYLDSDDIFQITGQGLDYFGEVFGTDYPFAKFDQVFVADHVGAMENVGCVTITEALLFRSRVTDRMYEARAMIILHEMAHQWFGDLVTMAWWDDLWLNESFAEYTAFLATAEATRFTQSWTSFALRKAEGYLGDQLPSTHPIAAEAATVSQAMGNVDAITYTKGAAVLRQLVAYTGRENFFAGLRAYFAEHGWGNARLADLLAALSASSGRDLGAWSKAWLQTAGPNTLRPDLAVDGDGRFTSFAVLQEAPAEHPQLRPHHLAIGLYNRDGGVLVRTHRVELDVTGARTEVPELAGLPRPDLILLNDDDLGYGLARFDDRSLRTLTTSIGEFSDSLARTVCWSAVLDMAWQAELPVPAYVATVAAGMGSETAISTLEMLHQLTSQILAVIADPRYVPVAKELLAGAGLDQLRAAEAGSDRQLAWAQLVSWAASSPGQLDVLSGLLAGTVEVPGLTVDTELRWALLSRLAATGRAGDAEIAAELERDNTDAGRRHAAACRAGIPDAEHKAEAWHQLTDDAALPLETAMEIARNFGRPEHAELLAPYAAKYFEILPQMFAGRSELVRMLLCPALFPYYAVSPDLLARIEDFLSQPGHDPAMNRIVIEGRYRVRKALESRALESSVPGP